MRVRSAYWGALAMCLGIFLGVTPIQAQEDDHSDNYEQATSVGLNSSTPGELNRPWDRDFFRIEVPRYGRVTVELRDVTELRYENPRNVLGATIGFSLKDYQIGVQRGCRRDFTAALPPYDVQPGVCVILVWRP